MTRKSILAAFALSITLTAPAWAEPVTQACLGNIDRLLECPSGGELADGTATGGSYKFCFRRDPAKSKYARIYHGPSIGYDSHNRSIVRRAGTYRDGKKHGRFYHFDEEGKLDRMVDYKNGEYDGASIRCHENGRVRSVTPHRNGKRHGVSQHWRKDGRFVYATEYADGQRVGQPLDLRPYVVAPAGICQPKSCDLETIKGSITIRGSKTAAAPFPNIE